jgi:tellurite methyltransferase
MFGAHVRVSDAYDRRMPVERTAPSADLRAEFGEIDIYLFDQLLRGRFDRRRRVLDAGCGAGRNLPFFLRRGFDVAAVDADPVAIDAVRHLAAVLQPSLPPGQLVCGPLDSLPWESGSFDAVVCSAVLHFARDEAHFEAMLLDLWRVLAPRGLLFVRLATSIGLEASVPVSKGRVTLPDGSERFVVDERTLVDWTAKLRGSLADPIKTTNVQNMRAMTTWVVEKPVSL